MARPSHPLAERHRARLGQEPGVRGPSQQGDQRPVRPEEASIRASIHSELDRQMRVLEERIASQWGPQFAERGRMAASRSARALVEELEDRIDILERGTASQLRALSQAQRSAESTQQQIGAAADIVQKALGPSPRSVREAPLATTQALVRPGTGKVVVARTDAPPQADPVAYCSKCLSTDISPSRKRNPLEVLLGLFLIQPVRCQRCFHRFFRMRGRS